MQNLQDVEQVAEDIFESHLGYDIVVTLWSDNRWTAWIAKGERVHGAEHVIMDNEITWDDRPDEDDLHTYIEERVQG